MQAWQIVLIAVGVILVVLVAWFISTYNAFVALRNRVEEAWRQIDVELHRRYDLIPNLVETVKGYAAHERGTLEAVTQARTAAAAAGADREQQVAQENMLTEAIGRLFAVAEQYPDLKANTNFQQLQSELSQTEDRIASGRRYYNAVVREFNTKLETFPASIVGSMTGFRRGTYFEAQGASRDSVRVDFGQRGPEAPGGASPGGSAPGGQQGGYGQQGQQGQLPPPSSYGPPQQ
ncbi:MAG TPA: LemA family protein [Actinomycetaceae bacterium]|nr:LemA family protein [Actinomycetaceae bacterium]